MTIWLNVSIILCGNAIEEGISNLFLFLFKAKTLSELIQPVEKRIEDVKQFLNSIDKTLIYEVVSIADAYGPTKSDPNLDVRRIFLASVSLIRPK